MPQQRSENNEFAISINNLTKYYGQIKGIENVSINVEYGSIHGFLGPNGAGKTTTIRILVGLLSSSSGNATIMSHPAGSLEAKKVVGYLPSDFALYDFYTVLEYLDFLEQLRGKTPYKDELIERFNVEINKKTSSLSRGNRQKVAIVQALMHEPKVLIADEPTTGLDPLNQAEFNAYLEEYINRGGTAFISSHILAEVQDVADFVTVIREGSIVDSGKVETLLSEMPRKAILKIKDTASVDKIISQLGAQLGQHIQDKITVYFEDRPRDFVGKMDEIPEIENFVLPEPSLEEYFLPLYQKENKLRKV